MTTVNLGDRVKDPVTGFIGIAVCRNQYLQGCDRITVQPPMDKDGKLQDCESFDEPQLKVTKKAAVKRQTPKKDPGGPDKFKSKRKY